MPYDRKRWGKNLLGKALMTVRERIQKELDVSGPGGDELGDGVNHNSEKVLSEGQA